MNLVKIMTKYIHDVKCNIRLKFVSIVTTDRQNVPYLIHAIWYVCQVNGTMIFYTD